MKKLGLILAVVAVGVLVACTYHYFEAAVRQSIDLIWNDWLDTEVRRWLVLPLCALLSLVFFGVQHWLDPASENHESHGLGDMPKPTLENYAKVLAIGFLSLVAGASLGPEAILVPACMIVGGLVGAQLFNDNKVTKLLAMAGFVALFAAFFHSFIAGLLGLLLVKKQTKLRLSPAIVVIGAVASASTYFTLKLWDSGSYVQLPHYTWKLTVSNLLAIIILVVAGFVATHGLGGLHQVFKSWQQGLGRQSWVIKGLLAAVGLSVLYLIGGSLVQFTGNESIVPMLEQAGQLGMGGLLLVLLAKLAAISWSKAFGYRGGMIFPMVFAASVLVAMLQLVIKDANFIYGLLAVLVGAFAADSKVKILT